MTWPADLRPSTSSFYLEANTSRSESPLSRATQVLVRPGARWRCDLSFDSRNRATAARLDAILASLDGSGQEVLLFDFRRVVPRGAAALMTGDVTTTFDDGTEFDDATDFADGTVATAPRVLFAAGAGADVVTSAGWAPREHALLAGDYVGISGRLYMVCNDARASAGGVVDFQLRPRLRAPVAAETVIVTDRPTARFRLADNSQGGNRTQVGLFSSYSISLLESLP